jgi:TMEM175 potassium channel family protein
MSEQVEHANDEHGDELGFERLVFFSDAVMAIAITLMALEIRLPELEPDLAADQISAAFQTLLPHIGVYVLSFLVIGLYWMVHHRLFRIIRHFDASLLWLNLIFLMMVAFLPVATNTLGTYPNLGLTTAFYAVSIALVGLSEFVVWYYALRKHYMPSFVAPRAALYYALRILVPPAVFLFSLLIIPFDVDWAKYSWALMIPILFILGMIFPRERAERDAYQRGKRA